MSDTTFLRDFSAQPAKPVTNQLSPLSGSYSDADARPAARSAVSSTPTERYSNATLTAPAPPVEKPASVSQPSSTVPPATDSAVDKTAKEDVPLTRSPEVTVVAEKPKEVKRTEKFTYGVVGSVPPGYKAAVACVNCKHFDSWNGICQCCNFPCASNYSCDKFELIGAPNTEEGDETEKYSQSATVKEPQLSLLDQAVVDYEVVLSSLADGDVASVALNKVVERFSKRSDYADAFLKLKYRRLYEDKHGNLEGAFVTAEEGN